jgi:hypothetical protein
VFSFLKDMVDAIKEGAAEARDEAGAAEAARQARMADRAAQTVQPLQATPEPERLATAFAAPCREIFLTELANAADGKQPPVHLFRASLPEEETKSWKALLARDFEIKDADDAEVAFLALAADGGPESDLGAVQRLREDPAGPWQVVAWPQP